MGFTMKVKVNTKRRGNPSVKALHSTLLQNISKPSSASSIKGIAGKLRSLSVVLSDIAKDKDLLSHQGWESVGHGVWKLKYDNFQHATRHIKGRRKPTGACFQEKNVVVALGEHKLRRTSSIESVTVVTNLRSRRHVEDEKKKQSSCGSFSQAEVVEIPVKEQPVHGSKMVGGSGAGISLQESNAKHEKIEKRIKVNLSRQKIGPSGEMGWRVRRRDSFQKDSTIPGNTRVVRRLSVDLSESDSIRQKRGIKVENRRNSDENLVSVSIEHGKAKESSNKVVLRSLKRGRSSADIHSTQDISVPSYARKTRRESMENSTKEQGHGDCSNNEKISIVSNGRELLHLHTVTKGKRDNSVRECPKDSLYSDSPRASKVRAVEISCESKTLASTRIRRSIKKEDKSNDVPTMISSQHERDRLGVHELVSLMPGERKSARFSLNVENGRRSVRAQKSLKLVQSDTNALRKEEKKERCLEKTLKESNLQNHPKIDKSKSKKIENSVRQDKKIEKSDTKFLVKKANVRVKKPQKLSRIGRVDPILGKRLKSAIKEEIKGGEINKEEGLNKGADNVIKEEGRIPRKRSNKVQLEWCSYCGLQLDSVENRLEHEFTHEEPRQLQVSLHLCSLNSTSVKLPVYVDLDEVAALKSPLEDDYSPDVNDNRPLYDVTNVLNDDEYEAYEDTSDSVNEDEDYNQEGSVSNNEKNVPSVSDSNQSEVTEVKMNSPRKAKEKAHVKMRLWVKSPRITRSSRSDKQLVQKNENIEECTSLMAADFISGDVLPPEDGLHDYVEVVVDKGSPERIMADDETIKDVDVSPTDQGDSEASKTSAELSPVDKNMKESLKEDTDSRSKEFEEGPEIVTSSGMDNSGINSNEIIVGEHHFREDGGEKQGSSENFDVGFIEKTGDNLELNAVEAEDEIIGNLGPKMSQINNEIDEDDVRSSDPKLSEINNDTLEDEMEDIKSDLCKVDCGNIEDEMENLNANFREMNDGIVGEIIGLDPNENELHNGTVRSKIESLVHNSSEIDHEKIGIDYSSHELTERKGVDNQEKTFNRFSTEANENTVENELESLDRKLTEINNQQDEEERKSFYSSMAATTSKMIEGEVGNKDQLIVEVDDVTEDYMGSIVPDLSDLGNETEGEVRKLDSTLNEAKSNISSCMPDSLNIVSREENDEKVCSESESLDLTSSEICGLHNKANVDDSQSHEVSDICTDLDKVNEPNVVNEVEDFDGEPNGTDSLADGVEDDLEDNLASGLPNQTNIDDSQSPEVDDICTDLDKVNEPNVKNQVEDSDGEPIGTDSLADGVEDDLEDNLASGLPNQTNIDDSQSPEVDDICTDLDKVNEPNVENEVEDSDGEPMGTESKVDGAEDDLEDISDEEDVKQKEGNGKVDREMDGLEDISDGEFEPIDEQNLAENVEDGVTSGRGKEVGKVMESLEELLGEKKVKGNVSIAVEDRSEVVIEDDIKSLEGIVQVPPIKVEVYDEDEDDRDTIILDHGHENPLEVEEFIRLRECVKDEEVDEESRDSDLGEGEKAKNIVTGIESMDAIDEGRVSSLNNNCMDEVSNFKIESTENEENENLSNTVSSGNVEIPTTAKDDSLAIINGDTKTAVFEEENLVKSNSVVGCNTETFSECEARREPEEEKTAVCCQ
ncbi:hypothetical protein J437_LFUL001321 [Ladona fulva]|uniref:C2H2-type domain-containing protein n=1 Tax=Ladona fulva TaxID=123851 RepID=A0A8K0NRT5_LADFU|nr:hypothetical protein J437_LFUL001321 [Ladona fulva]